MALPGKRLLPAFFALFLSATAIATPITVSELGNLSGVKVVGGNLDPYQVHWVSFVLDEFTFLDIDTFATFEDGLYFDTSLGLYDSFGNLLFQNDASNIEYPHSGCTGSDLDFCAALFLVSTQLQYGTYFLALGGFETEFGLTAFSVSSSCIYWCDGGPGRDYKITFSTDNSKSVPEPGPIGLLCLGLAGLMSTERRNRA